jgi:cation diffusion facilitator CzcD-associated flavoprotein CzcO
MAPGSSEHAVVIIGAGMSGLCMGIRLRERGIRDFVILDRAPAVGGTWHDNRYPGAGCDVPSVLYSYSFAPNPRWSRKFSLQPEIRDYLERTAERFGLVPHLRLGCAVRSARWEDSGRWRVELESGEALTCRALVSALGQLNVPHIPDFPGAGGFAGEQFHSARWREDLDLAGKRVAVIGNAASAVQFIPKLAQSAARLYVYQRSANYIVPRNDRAYRDWEKVLFERVPLLQKLARLGVWLRGEWLLYPVLRRDSRLLRWCFETWCRRYLEREIGDPALRRQLTPDYRVGCKRILFSDDYYGAFRREQVELVTAPIEAIGEAGVVTADGIPRPVDVIIHATGFRTNPMLSAVAFHGRDGRSLADAWAAGAEAYRGVCATGFPNFFMLYGPNTNLGSNSIIFMVERQCARVVDCIDKLLAHDLAALEVNAGVQQAWNDRLQGELARTVWSSDCASWYKNDAGRITNNWPRSTAAYWWQLRAVDFSDFDMTARAGAAP